MQGAFPNQTSPNGRIPQQSTSYGLSGARSTSWEYCLPLGYTGLMIQFSATGAHPANTAIRVAAALGCAYMAWRIAWLSDDAFITFRYVRNCLGGYGVVYNLGERVQGFTHPLWFLLLTGGGFFLRIPALAVWMGLGLTFLAVLVAGGIWRGRPTAAVCLALLLIASYSFREFQTSGLENPLTHGLAALALYCALGTSGHRRNLPLAAAAAVLAVFNRLDQMPLLAPLFVYILYRITRESRLPAVMRTWQGMALLGAAAALLGWYSWCAYYFGNPLPNTFFAKTGVIPLSETIVRGILYLIDFIRDEPFPGLVLAASPILQGYWLWRRKSRHSDDSAVGIAACTGAGMLLQLAYVIAIGGDFMRGRFLVSVYFTACVMAVWALVDLWPKRLLFITCLVAAAAFMQLFFDPVETTGRITQDQRLTRESTYWHQNRWSYLCEHGYEREFFNSLRLYAETFGPVTIKEDIIGVCGWMAGPKVSIIDRFGLIDPYIASLPGDPASRTGHIKFEIPEAYLRARGVLNLQPDWMDRVRGLDPSLRGDALADMAE